MIPVAGMAAWISAGVGNGWPDGMGVERPAPVLCTELLDLAKGRPRCESMEGNLPLAPSGLAARLPGNWGPPTGLVARDPWGLPLREVAEGGFSLSFLVLPLSLSSPPDPTPISTSLPDPEPPSGALRMRFLPA